MVASGRLGRKAGGGFYEVGRSWRDEVGALEAEADAAVPGADAVAGGRAVLERVVAQLVNEAAFALAEGIATADAIDQAMVVGLNHPCGPGEWSRSLGADRIVSILDALWDQEHDQRYRVAPLLRRQASA
jgi:3-hydroxybutyryl-CoA dehydrogenase